jgi:hypothetical protein
MFQHDALTRVPQGLRLFPALGGLSPTSFGVEARRLFCHLRQALFRRHPVQN